MLAGAISLVLPLLPGWIFFSIGLILLSLYSPRLRDWLDARTRRWPKVHDFVHRMRKWADGTIGSI